MTDSQHQHQQPEIASPDNILVYQDRLLAGEVISATEIVANPNEISGEALLGLTEKLLFQGSEEVRHYVADKDVELTDGEQASVTLILDQIRQFRVGEVPAFQLTHWHKLQKTPHSEIMDAARAGKARYLLFERRRKLSEAMRSIVTPEQFSALFPDSVQHVVEERTSYGINNSIRARGESTVGTFFNASIQAMLRVSNDASTEERHQLATAFWQGMEALNTIKKGNSTKNEIINDLLHVPADTAEEKDVMAAVVAQNPLALDRLKRLLVTGTDHQALQILGYAVDKMIAQGDLTDATKQLSPTALTEIMMEYARAELVKVAPEAMIAVLDRDGTYVTRSGGRRVIWSIKSLFQVANALGKQLSAHDAEAESKLPVLSTNAINIPVAMAYITEAIKVSDPSINTTQTEEAVQALDSMAHILERGQTDAGMTVGQFIVNQIDAGQSARSISAMLSRM